MDGLYNGHHAQRYVNMASLSLENKTHRNIVSSFTNDDRINVNTMVLVDAKITEQNVQNYLILPEHNH